MNHKTNLGIRAILYSARKWKKTLLVFCLLLAITTLVLSGLAIADAQEEQAEEVRGTTGASFTVERNLSTGGWASGNSGSYSTQEFISEEMLQKISSVDGVAGYDAAVVSMPSYYNEAGEELVNGNVINSYYTYGSINTEYNQLFSSGRFELVEGSHITENVKNGLIISKENAERNGIKIGDKVTGINDPNNGDPEVDMEIVGFFDIVADKNDEATMYDASTLWDYAAQLDNVIAEVQNISSINWDNFIITANDEVYQNISSALSDTGTLITTLIVVITAVSMVLIILILSMSIRSRKRETGILLAVGIAKPAVILQYVLETMLIAVVAFPLAYLSSKQIAGTLGTLFGKAAENVIVTPQHFMLVAIVGGVLLVAAVLVSSISTMRLKPKQILAQME